MHQLNLPPRHFKIKETEGKRYIFDELRRKYVALTPEEWVRQHFTAYLICDKHYPAGRTGHEISLMLNQRRRRCDTVVYDCNGNPLIIVEYKAPDISVTQQTFDQIVRYNMVFRVSYLIVSNGITHYCCRIDYKTQQYCFLKDIPDYREIER